MPPLKCRLHYVVEEAPSHDGTPCFTAWVRAVIAKVPKGWCSSDFRIDDERPEWSIQIYDTTPGSDNSDHLKSLAKTLHEETWEEREGYGRGKPDRIDVWGIPLPTTVSDEERIEKCKAHFMAETASREVAACDGFHISLLDDDDDWQRGIVIIDRPKEIWNEGEGGFLAVNWDVQPQRLEYLAAEYGEDHQEPQTDAFRYTRDELGSILADLRDGFSTDD